MDFERTASRIYTSFQDNPSSDKRVETVRIGQDSTSDRSSSGTSRLSTTEERHRICQREEESRFLFSRLHRAEKERVLETDNKLTHTEPLFGDTNFPYGISEQDSCHHHRKRVGYFVRPNRRLFSRASSSALQKIPSVRGQRTDLSVHGPSVRTFDCSTSIHKDAPASSCTSSLSGNCIPPILGRSLDTSLVSYTGSTMDGDGDSLTNQARLSHQHPEVNVGSSSTIHLPRSQIPYGSRHHDSTRRQICQHSGKDVRALPTESSSSHQLALTSRSPGLRRETGSMGKTLYPSHPDLSSSSIQHGASSTHTSSSSGYHSHVGSTVVDEQGECFSWTSPRPIQPPGGVIHGCQPDILGCSRRSRRLQSERVLDVTRVTDVDQLPRATSSSSSPTDGATLLEGETHLSSVGQLHYSLLHKQVWRNKVSNSTRLNLGTIPASATQLPAAESSPHPRETEQTGRFPLENQPSGRHRMDHGSLHSESSLGYLGDTQYRPDGYEPLEATTGLHLSIPGPSSLRGRRNILQLGGNGRIYLSTVANDRAGVEQDSARRLCSNGDHPSMAEPPVVPCTSGTTSRLAKTTTHFSRADHDASQPLQAREPAVFTSTRLQTIFQSATSQGFSREVSRRIATGQHRGSTQNIYCSRWRAFDRWCHERNQDPCLASVAQLAEFLLHLFQDKSLSPSSISGYRSAINSVWRVLGRSSTESYHLTQLLKSFKVDRPRSLVVHPKWDLALVLSMLSKPPYEPLQRASFKDLSAKTVFLLLLASSRRRGDIHAIDPKRVTITTAGHAILVPCPGYLPKIRSTAEGQSRYQPILIRSLSSLTTDEAELTLCPVRALRHYETVAKQRAPDRRQFFISTASPVSKNTLSAWTVKVIRKAYASATEDDIRPYRTSTHEIRALAASLALQANFSLANVLGAATWANPTTFTEFYLRDVSGLQGRLHVIAPCVVAGTTLH